MPNFERFLIIGDFNIHICCQKDSFVKDFINLTEVFDLVQMVTGPTHLKGHTLDLILSHGILLNEIEICERSFSDHSPITFSMPVSRSTINHCKTDVKAVESLILQLVLLLKLLKSFLIILNSPHQN